MIVCLDLVHVHFTVLNIDSSADVFTQELNVTIGPDLIHKKITVTI